MAMAMGMGMGMGMERKEMAMGIIPEITLLILSATMPD